MIHLFKKVYIETDHKLDVDENRIVISESLGYNFSPVYDEICAGKLYYCAENFESMLKNFGAEEIAEKNKPENQIDSGNVIILREEKEIFDNFYEFLNFVDRCYDEKKEPLYIHVDQKAFNFFMVYWYKILFPNITFDSFSSLLSSYIFFNKIFSNGVKSKMNSAEFNLVLEETETRVLFEEIVIDETESKQFIDIQIQNLSIEYLLSSYFYDSKYFVNLLKPFSALLKKSIEVQIYENKELLMQNLNKQFLLEAFNVSEKYNFNNFSDIITNEQELSFIFDKNIWTKSINVIEGSSSGTINFKNLTEENIETLCKIRSITEMSKEEIQTFGLNAYISQYKKFISFKKYFEEKEILTEGELKTVLSYDVENKDNFTYSFLVPSSVPVNFYFLDYIFTLEQNDNVDELKKYTLR
jgi:hypothetical protein